MSLFALFASFSCQRRQAVRLRFQLPWTMGVDARCLLAELRLL
jgi:hypothetical protein